MYQEKNLSELRDFVYKHKVLSNSIGYYLAYRKEDNTITNRDEEIVKSFFFKKKSVEEISTELGFRTNASTLKVLKSFIHWMEFFFDPQSESKLLVLNSRLEASEEKFRLFKQAHSIVIKKRLENPDMELLTKSIYDCGFSVKLINILRNLEIEIICDIFNHKKIDFLQVRHCGKVTIAELEEFLLKNGNLKLQN